MSRPWNPNDPTRVGLEFEPTSYNLRSLSSDQAAVIQKMRCTASDTITDVDVAVRTDRTGGLLFAMHLEGNELATDIQTTTYLPTADAAQLAFTGPAFEPVNLYQWIDDPNPRSPVAGADYIRCNGDDFVVGSAAYYVARFGGLAAFPAGRRILCVRQVMIAQGFPGWPTPWTHMIYRGTDAIHRFLGKGQFLPNTGWVTLTKEYTYNPQTGAPFTVAELQAMGGTTGQCGFGIQYGFGSTGPSAGIVFTLGLEVVHCAENRVAFGGRTIVGPGTQLIWENLPVRTPAGGTTFARASGNDYSYVIQRRIEPDGGDQPSPFLGVIGEWGGNMPPADTGIDSPTMLEGWEHYGAARIGAFGQVESLGAKQPSVWPIVTVRSGGTVSPDTQGYREPLYARVFGGTTARTEIMPSGAGSMGVLRVGVRPATNGPVADLRLRLFRSADNVQIGGDAILSRADWDDAPYAGYIGDRPIKYVNVPMASPGAVSGFASFYILADSAGSTGLLGINGYDAWEVVALTMVLNGTPTYGEVSEHFFYPGTTAVTMADWPAQAITVPTAPSAATLSLFDVVVQDDGTACAIPGNELSFPVITWEPTALGLAFSHYEVQRREPSLSADWTTIGRFTSETEIDSPFDPWWLDYEARRNVVTEYRVRVVRKDGGFSNWRTAPGSVTATMSGCQMVLVQAQLGLVIARNDSGQREWEFLNAAEVRHMRIYGADYQKAFTSLSRRGFRTTLNLVMYGKGSQFAPDAPVENWEMFTILDVWNAIGIVPACMLTETGQRVWGTLRLLRGRRHDSEADLYLAEVEFVQSSDVPPVIERADA